MRLKIVTLYCSLLAGLLALQVQAGEIWVSSSQGVYKLGESKPRFQKPLESGDKVSAFKTVSLADGRLVSAWGSGRDFVDRGEQPVAMLDLLDASGKGGSAQINLITTKGKRIRDFVVDGDYIVAAGHSNGDIHLFSLKDRRHKSVNHAPYFDSIMHSVRMGDVDGDGTREYYITVTSANVPGGLSQEGQVLRLDVDWSKFEAQVTVVVDASAEYDSYVKEIAVLDIDGDKQQELVFELAPQIEVYGPDDVTFIEPMRLFALGKDADKYVTRLLAVADIRLARTLSYSDLDQDGLNELFFGDFYQTGIYVLEADKDKRRAIGENVNLADTGWRLTRLKAVSEKGEDQLFTTQLKTNHVVHLEAASRLLAGNDSSRPIRTPSKLRVPPVPMSLHSFEIKENAEGYYLQPAEVYRLTGRGEVWHINH